jgi:hypothetical protein
MNDCRDRWMVMGRLMTKGGLLCLQKGTNERALDWGGLYCIVRLYRY